MKNILRQLPVHEETTVKQSYRAVCYRWCSTVCVSSKGLNRWILVNYLFSNTWKVLEGTQNNLYVQCIISRQAKAWRWVRRSPERPRYRKPTWSWPLSPLCSSSCGCGVPSASSWGAWLTTTPPGSLTYRLATLNLFFKFVVYTCIKCQTSCQNKYRVLIKTHLLLQRLSDTKYLFLKNPFYQRLIIF